MDYPQRLAGRVALVTGANRGQGKAIALRFAKEGANVAVNCLPMEEYEQQAQAVVDEIKSLGRDAIVAPADVSVWEQVDAMVTQVVDRLGRLDILANNAGIFIDPPMEETTIEIWDRTLDVNLKSQFYTCRRCIPEMLKQGKGKIINTATIDGYKIGGPSNVAYAASKAGVVGLTRALAYEYAPKKINVNAIAPGQIDTNMTRDWTLVGADEGYWQSLIDRTPFGRLGVPDDMAALVAFLAADESEFMNGSIVLSDGGWLLT